MSLTGTLDGEKLCSGGSIGWSYTSGADPHVRLFVMERAAAEAVALRAQAFGSVLVLTVPGYGSETIKGLTVLGLKPSSDPSFLLVEVADRRWALSDRRVYGRFNIRRRTGDRRRVGAANAPLSVQPIVDDVAFAPWTLAPSGNRWTGVEFLKREMDAALLAFERFTVRDPLPAVAPVEDVVMDDTAAGAIRRACAYFGDCVDLFVDSDGTYVVYSRVDQSERKLVNLGGGGSQVRGQGGSGPLSVVGPPLWRMGDQSLTRASSVRVLFSRLAELRFDGGDTVSGRREVERGDVPLRLEPVLAVPDLELQIPALNGRAARTVLQGTWVTLEEALAAWNALGWPGGRTLTLALIRRHLVAGGLYLLFAQPLLDQEGIYRARIDALCRAYRRIYRIPRRWRDRLGSIFAARAELRDAEDGGCAPAPVYMDYATLLTRRGQEKALTANPKNATVFVNRFAVPPSGGSVISAAVTSMRPAPFDVAIIDHDQGVLELVAKITPTLGERQLFPSAIENGSSPIHDPTQPVLFASAARLAETHEVSVILSAEVVAPNDRRALHVEEVQKSAAERALGVGVNVGACKGPVAELRVVPAGRRRFARFAWDDTKADQIRGAFGLVAEDPAPTNAWGQPLNPDELQALAQAEAARYYAQRLDHVVGSLTTGWRPGIRPTGAASTVSYSIATDGTPTTTVEFLADLPGPDTFALLPDAVRKTALGEVTP